MAMTAQTRDRQMVRIDGAQGEGGGQILRSSLSLAALTGRPVELFNIRARRKKPGLLRQHLTAARAVARICNARIEGDALRSDRLTLEPGPIVSGTFRFAVGSAGSASLVCQTVLPVLLAADGPSEVIFEGGTHNPMAPPFDFLEQVYLPLLRRMGVEVEAELERAGFYPAAGGRFRLRVNPKGRPGPVPALTRGGAPAITAWTVTANLPRHIARRELEVVCEAFGLSRAATRPREVDAPGVGNAVCIQIDDGEARELVTAFGKKGVLAEEIAAEAVAQARVFLDSSAPVGEHLADMLVLLAGLYGGSFHAGVWSKHASTNVEVVRAFLGADALSVSHEADGTRVTGRSTRP